MIEIAAGQKGFIVIVVGYQMDLLGLRLRHRKGLPCPKTASAATAMVASVVGARRL